MKILQINALYGSKSTGTIVKDISGTLRKNGEKAYVICIESTEGSNDVFALGYHFSNKIHALLTRLMGRQGFWSQLSTKGIIKMIRGINPDIIHIHNLHSNFINLPQLLDYCSVNNKPLVVTLHDCWYFTGKCYHFQDIACKRWLTGCGKCPKRYLDIPSVLYDSSSSTFKLKEKGFSTIRNLHVVGCSQWITNLANQSPILKNAQFHTIYNGVDTGVFNMKSDVHRNENTFTILVMANKWFLPENAPLRDRIVKESDGKFQIRVVGCSQQQLESAVAHDNISYVGYLKGRGELAVEYNKADVFLNITYIDTLPTVNMEALSCGTPVITYQSGGSPELVSEGRTGYIVEQGDLDAVLKALHKVKAGNISRIECAKYAQDHFNKDHCYQQYLDLYKQII